MSQRVVATGKRTGLRSRAIVTPLAVITIASLYYMYSTTAIKAAKRNAKMHREADGGQINWQNESMRRHGMLDRPATQKGSVIEFIDEVRKGATERDSGASKPKKS